MNQVTNLIQWKNLTDEEKAGFDFENYKYEYQICREWIKYEMGSIDPRLDMVYQLVIEDDKWYYWVWEGESFIKLGSQVVEMHRGGYSTIRPARPDEIPQDERTLEQKIQDKWPDKKVVMLAYTGKFQELTFPVGTLDRYHFAALSMKGFFFYVYQIPQDGSFFLDTKAAYCWNEGTTIQPIAVLFEGEG